MQRFFIERFVLILFRYDLLPGVFEMKRLEIHSSPVAPALGTLPTGPRRAVAGSPDYQFRQRDWHPPMDPRQKKKKKAKGRKSKGERDLAVALPANDPFPEATSGSAAAAAEAKSKKRKRSKMNPRLSTTQPSSNRSLASELKRRRGTAATTPLPAKWSLPPTASRVLTNNILTPSDGHIFMDCLRRSYRGLSWQDPETLPSNLHSSFSAAFGELDDAGLFLYDIVQPGRQRLSRTMVTRTLIGEPGSTYRYLGLRLFSHPWCDVDKEGNRLASRTANAETEKERGSTLIDVGYRRDCARGLLRVGSINRTLVGRSETVLQDEIAPHITDGLVGSADYNLTLINKMLPSSLKRDLKSENIYGLGKTSVSWHKDSGLQDFSSIAVYHALKNYDAPVEGVVGGRKRKGSGRVDAEGDEKPWRVAVRVASTDSTTPALSIPLPSGALYYLLDDFNHQHEHAVLAGSSKLRYSSTHRVAREGRGTWQYIRDKCGAVLSKPDLLDCGGASSLGSSSAANTASGKKKQLVKDVRAQQLLLTELEFEWIRQWHVQGRTHAQLHPYWHKPMERLSVAYRDLERRSVQVLTALRRAAAQASDPSTAQVGADLFDVMIECLQERKNLRASWRDRYRDPIFASLPDGARPMACPFLDRGTDPDAARGQMREDLAELVSDLRRWRASFYRVGGSNVDRSMEKMGGRKVKKKAALTKKEQKRVASNWESMKSSMKRKK